MEGLRTLADFMIVLIILPTLAFMVGKLFSIQDRVVRLETKINFLVDDRVHEIHRHETTTQP